MTLRAFSMPAVRVDFPDDRLQRVETIGRLLASPVRFLAVAEPDDSAASPALPPRKTAPYSADGAARGDASSAILHFRKFPIEVSLTQSSSTASPKKLQPFVYALLLAVSLTKRGMRQRVFSRKRLRNVYRRFYSKTAKRDFKDRHANLLC